MLLRQLQTLPYLTNQPFDVAEIRGAPWSRCQMKMAAGANAHECEISKSRRRRRRRGVWAGSATSESEEKKGQDNWPGLNGHQLERRGAPRRNKNVSYKEMLKKRNRKDLPNVRSCQTRATD